MENMTNTITQNSKERSEIPVCKTCQSPEVVKDAWAAWDENTQDWSLASVFDECFCKDCDGYTSIVWIEAEYCAPKFTLIVMVEIGTEYIVPIQAGDIDAAEDAAMDYMLANDLITIEQVENASVTDLPL